MPAATTHRTPCKLTQLIEKEDAECIQYLLSNSESSSRIIPTRSPAWAVARVLARGQLPHTKIRTAIPKGPWSLSSLTSIMQGKPSKLACPERGKAVLWKHCLVSWQQHGSIPYASKASGMCVSDLILRRNFPSLTPPTPSFRQWMTAVPKDHTYRQSHGKQSKGKEPWLVSVQPSSEYSI